MAKALKKRALAEYSQTIQETAPAVSLKRLRLTARKEGASSAFTLIKCLESFKNSNDALQTLLRISDCFDFEAADIPEAIHKLSEHFKIESESAVRVKILSLFADIGSESGADVTSIIEEAIVLMKNETSHKVLAQGMSTFLKLGRINMENVALHQKLIDIAKNYLKDVSHAVKCNCLELIGALMPVNNTGEAEAILKLIGSYFYSEDARVRSQAFKTMITLHERGIKLSCSVYGTVCEALKDDYEIVRQAALKLIWIIGKVYPENIIALPESEQQIRLADDAFGKICNGVTDLSMYVRMLAAQLLGTMTVVSPKFLNQTLDKKLMSNMRKKRSAHELAWENVTSGEWASGKKWADDAPRECLDADTINLMSSGACGAFVHGLEDEFLEVRSASVESLCQLSVNNAYFANTALDFLVDMLNDEIEDVRLNAIDSLRLISEHITLREDQLETMLGAIEDFSQEVREGLHRMLASCRIATTSGLQMCVEKLLDNLRRYPQDKRSTYRCIQRIGAQHPELVLPLVPQLLGIHPFFDMAEPDVDSPAYICILILIFNAAKYNTTIIQLLEPHTLRHYAYLHDTMPTLVPLLNIREYGPGSSAKPTCTTESLMFIKTVINGLESSSSSVHLRASLLEKAKEHLNRLAEKDEGVAGTAQFTAQFIGAQLLMCQILEQGYWCNPRGLATQQVNTLNSTIQQLLSTCLKLQHLFVGFTAAEAAAIKQFRLRAMAINFVYMVKGSNASALAPCHNYLAALEDMQKELIEHRLDPDAFTAEVMREIGGLEEPKPGTVARILVPLLQNVPMTKILEPSTKVQMSSAVILEPTGQTDSTLKFTAGLIMAVPFEAELRHLADPSRLRLKVKYPDQLTQVVLPRTGHLKPLYFDSAGAESRAGSNLRLLTTVLVSHQVWTEACNVDINIAIAVPEADVDRRKSSTDNTQTLIDLCKPVRVSVAPKPIKRNL